MTNAETLKAASQFDQLPDDAIVTTATAAVILGRHAHREYLAAQSADQAPGRFRSAATASASAICAN